MKLFKYLIILCFFLNLSIVLEASEGSRPVEEWKAPEEPKNEAESKALKDSIAKKKEEIAQRQEEIARKLETDPTKKSDQTELNKAQNELKVEEAVLSGYEADQTLAKDPDNDKAQQQKEKAQAQLQASMNALQAESTSTDQSTTPTQPPGTQGQSSEFKMSDYSKKLESEINQIGGSSINMMTGQRITFLENEVKALEEGRQSDQTGVKYDSLTLNQQKAALEKILSLLNNESIINIDDLTGAAIDAVTKKEANLRKRITEQIAEINNFKKLPPIKDNALDAKLNLSSKIADERLAAINKELDPATFDKRYPTEKSQTKFFGNLREILDIYNIPYTEYYAFVSPGGASFLEAYLFRKGFSGARTYIIDQMRNDIFKEDYANQKRLIEAVLDVLAKAKIDIRAAKDAFTNRLQEIDQFIKDKEDKKIPQPEKGTLADTLKLSDMIPSDQMKVIEQQQIKVIEEMQRFKDQLALLGRKPDSGWTAEDFKNIENIYKPYQDFLTQVDNLYKFSQNDQYKDAFNKIKNIINTDVAGIEQARPAESKPTWGDKTGSFIEALVDIGDITQKSIGEKQQAAIDELKNLPKTVQDATAAVADAAMEKSAALIEVGADVAAAIGDGINNAVQAGRKSIDEAAAVVKDAIELAYEDALKVVEQAKNAPEALKQALKSLADAATAGALKVPKDLALKASQSIDNIVKEIQKSKTNIDNIEKLLKDLPLPIQLYIQGLQGYVWVGAKAAGQAEVAKQIKLSGQTVQSAKDFLDIQLNKVTNQLQKVSNALLEFATKAQDEVAVPMRSNDPAQIQIETVNLNKLKKLLGDHRNSILDKAWQEPAEIAKQQSFAQIINDFFKKFIDWVMGRRGSPASQQQKANAQKAILDNALSNYNKARQDYLTDIGFKSGQKLTTEEIKNAMLNKFQNPKDTKHQALYNTMIESLSKVVSATQEQYRAQYEEAQVLQGYYYILREAFNQAEGAVIGKDNANESTAYLYAMLEAYDSKINTLNDIMAAMKQIELTLRASGDKQDVIALKTATSIQHTLASDIMDTIVEKQKAVDNAVKIIDTNINKLNVMYGRMTGS